MSLSFLVSVVCLFPMLSYGQSVCPAPGIPQICGDEDFPLTDMLSIQTIDVSSCIANNAIHITKIETQYKYTTASTVDLDFKMELFIPSSLNVLGMDDHIQNTITTSQVSASLPSASDSIISVTFDNLDITLGCNDRYGSQGIFAIAIYPVDCQNLPTPNDCMDLQAYLGVIPPGSLYPYSCTITPPGSETIFWYGAVPILELSMIPDLQTYDGSFVDRRLSIDVYYSNVVECTCDTSIETGNNDCNTMPGAFLSGGQYGEQSFRTDCFDSQHLDYIDIDIGYFVAPLHGYSSKTETFTLTIETIDGVTLKDTITYVWSANLISGEHTDTVRFTITNNDLYIGGCGDDLTWRLTCEECNDEPMFYMIAPFIVLCPIAMYMDNDLLLWNGIATPDNEYAAFTLGTATTYTCPISGTPCLPVDQCPTSDPTTATPTASPTGPPTTSAPFAAPSRSPITDDPSTSPTIQPTLSPITSDPSSSPSSHPTTSMPSVSPTTLTSNPTTADPTSHPTSAPTTHDPTATPITSYPTLNPTFSSNYIITSYPTAEPTSAPVTGNPTTAPVTGNPTTAPTTSLPTLAPSIDPTSTTSDDIVFSTSTATGDCEDVTITRVFSWIMPLIDGIDTDKDAFGAICLQALKESILVVSEEDTFIWCLGFTRIVFVVQDEERRRLLAEDVTVKVTFNYDDDMDATVFEDAELKTEFKSEIETLANENNIFMDDSDGITDIVIGEAVRLTPTTTSTAASTATSLLVIISILAIALLLIASGYIYSVRGAADDFNYVAVVLFGIYAWDFFSDILFAVDVWTSYLSPNADEEIPTRAYSQSTTELVLSIIFGCSVAFILIPLFKNFYDLIKYQGLWQQHPLHADRYRSWLDQYGSILFGLSFICGSTFGSISLVNSNLFGRRLFCMGLSKVDLREFNQHRLINVIIGENVPQLIIQIFYASVIEGGVTTIAFAAITSSSLSICAAVLDFASKKTILSDENVNQTLFSVKVASKQEQFNQNISKYKHRTRNLSAEIAHMFGLVRNTVEVLPIEKFSDSKYDGLIVHFFISTSRFEPKKLFEKLNVDDQSHLTRQISKAWGLQKDQTIVYDLEFMIKSKDTGNFVEIQLNEYINRDGDNGKDDDARDDMDKDLPTANHNRVEEDIVSENIALPEDTTTKQHGETQKSLIPK